MVKENKPTNVTDKDTKRTGLKLIDGRISREGNYEIVRIPILYAEFKDRKTGIMTKYSDIYSYDDVKKAKKWMKNNGFIYNTRKFWYERRLCRGCGHVQSEHYHGEGDCKVGWGECKCERFN